MAAVVAMMAVAPTPALAAECDVTSVGLDPLTDPKARYRGRKGGLYPRGQNVRPSAHEAFGYELANAIEPLDADGDDSAAGKYALVAIGMSNTTQEFATFKSEADVDAAKDPRLVIVDGAQSGVTASEWADPNNPAWRTVETRLASAGVTAEQVQIAWVKAANIASGGWPGYAKELSGDMADIARNLESSFPNIKIAYYSSRIYAGYASTALNPEPYAYESGYAVKWLIGDQIAGRGSLNYDPSKGPVEAPWLSWGPYLWADGLEGRRMDGLVWRCDDYGDDGTHPSTSGREKVARELLQFFKRDFTAKRWFRSDDPLPNATTTLESDARRTAYRRPFELSGRVAADPGCAGPFEISLRKRRHGSSKFKEIAPSIGVDAQGHWTFEHSSAVNAAYRAAAAATGCEPVPSAPLDVLVRAKVTARLPATCRSGQEVTGKVLPPKPGSRVVLKRRSGGGWSTVDRDELSGRSGYSVVAPSCADRYKVVWPRQDVANQAGRRIFSL